MVRAHRQTLFQEFTPKEPTACHLPILPKAGRGLVFKCTLHFVWQAWHLWHWAGSGGAFGSHLSPWTRQAWHLEASTSILCGRRGTWRKCLGATVFGHNMAHNNFTQLFHIQLSHTTLSHTTLSHIALSHNLSSTISMLLIPTFSHTTFSRKQLSHTQLTPTALSHTPLSYAPLSHNLSPTMSTQLTHCWITHFLTHNLLTHNLLTSNSHAIFSYVPLSRNLPSTASTEPTHTLLFHMHIINLLTHNLLTQNSLTRSVPPSPFSCLPFPSRLHLSFATYWKKLTCGVIWSFNL